MYLGVRACVYSPPIKKKSQSNSTHLKQGEAEGDVELPEPCETSQLPRSHVQIALPFANVTHLGAGAVDLKAALSSCPNVALPQSKLIIRYVCRAV